VGILESIPGDIAEYLVVLGDYQRNLRGIQRNPGEAQGDSRGIPGEFLGGIPEIHKDSRTREVPGESQTRGNPQGIPGESQGDCRDPRGIPIPGESKGIPGESQVNPR